MIRTTQATSKEIANNLAESETTLEGIRLLLAIGEPQPVAGGHFVLQLTNNTVTDLTAVTGGIPA